MTGILDLVPNLRRTGATNGGEYSGPCPWCAGTDRFKVWPRPLSGRARWWCRQCLESGDTIDLLRELKGLTFPEAAAAVGQPLRERHASPTRRRQEAPLRRPSTAWQSRAGEVAETAEATLWKPEGARALAYLQGRGFADGTIRAGRLGYIAMDRHENAEAWRLPADHRDIWIPRGIAIPWRAAVSCGA